MKWLWTFKLKVYRIRDFICDKQKLKRLEFFGNKTREIKSFFF